MNSTRLIAASTVLLAALASAPAFAGADSGFYLGAGVGQASASDIDIQDQEFNFDGDDTGYKALVGFNFGWIPLIDLAVEGSYTDFGKAGAANWDGNVSGSNISGDDDGTDPVYGVGARFALGSFQIRAEYEYFDIDVVDGIDFISASLLYTF
jgi:OmpA-like transmembrane domain